jgi:hypothetical protein
MKSALSEWLKLTDANKRNIFAETARRKALPVSSIEKDWWVIHALLASFSTEYADKIIFKGGTSLSKGWHLIERFSEDVDLVLDREFLGFTENPTSIPTVNPERTFLEKVFLLHEEYQRPPEKIRIERLSRHLYDIERLAQTNYFTIALTDTELYNTIVLHREKFSHLSGVDYAKHAPKYIQIVPPANLLPLWEKDYESMINSMVYGEKLSFNELIIRISNVQQAINTHTNNNTNNL